MYCPAGTVAWRNQIDENKRWTVEALDNSCKIIGLCNHSGGGGRILASTIPQATAPCNVLPPPAPVPAPVRSYKTPFIITSVIILLMIMAAFAFNYSNKKSGTYRCKSC